MKLSDFKAFSFDCYGTLIDWETGLLDALKPWLEKNAVMATDAQVLEAFAQAEHEVEAESPGALYPEILANCHQKMAAIFGIDSTPEEAALFGASVKDWPAFPDSSGALQYLSQHFKLYILSNIDRASFFESNKKLGVEFDRVFTAEEIGAYKPDEQNFQFMLNELKDEHNMQPDQLLHVAQSLFHDHVPAKNLGLVSAWIDRRAGKPGGGATKLPDPLPNFDFRFETLQELAEAHKAELA